MEIKQEYETSVSKHGVEKNVTSHVPNQNSRPNKSKRSTPCLKITKKIEIKVKEKNRRGLRVRREGEGAEEGHKWAAKNQAGEPRYIEVITSLPAAIERPLPPLLPLPSVGLYIASAASFAALKI